MSVGNIWEEIDVRQIQAPQGKASHVVCHLSDLLTYPWAWVWATAKKGFLTHCYTVFLLLFIQLHVFYNFIHVCNIYMHTYILIKSTPYYFILLLLLLNYSFSYLHEFLCTCDPLRCVCVCVCVCVHVHTCACTESRAIVHSRSVLYH